MHRLVLIGAGRAHLHLLRVCSRRPILGLEIVLVIPLGERYSRAMTSGYLRHVYVEEDLRIDVAALAERAGARVVIARADRIVAEEKVLVTGSERIPFDLCSIDDVGIAEGADLPGVSVHAVMLMPFSTPVKLRRALEAHLDAGGEPLRCAVVGGGRTGVEAAFALIHLLRERSRPGVITVVDGASDILRALPSCRQQARSRLERAGVCFALGARAVAVQADRILLASGAELPSDLTVWATSGRPAELIAASGLPHDAHGRLLADGALRSRDGGPLWAAGDCVSREAGSPNSPVGGRNEGELLERSLRATIGHSRLRLAVPWRGARCLVDTGDGRAIIHWGPLRGHFRLAWWLRNCVDRRHVRDLAGS